MKIKLLIATLALAATPALAQPAKTAPAPDAAKKGPTTPAVDTKKAAPPAMEMPKPPQELADAAKAMGGTWRCTAKVAMDPKNPTAMTDVKATISNRIDNAMGKWWLQSTFTSRMGKTTYKFVAYTTYNPTEKKWFRYMIDNMGGAETATSTGLNGGKTLVWEGEAMGQMPGMSRTKVKHTEEIVDAKNVKMKGEMSMDGKTWMTGYDSTCKK